MRRSLVAVSLAALALPLLVACGSDEEASTAGGTPAPTAPSAVACEEGAAEPTASKKFGSEPELEIPDGAPPCELVVIDLTDGSGKAVDTITESYDWNYEGVSWSTGETFDSSFERGESIAFSLNQVIPGWTEGLQGMKPDGRRMLVIPPDQAYGDSPPPGSGIAPGETLVFVVDLVGPTGS